MSLVRCYATEALEYLYSHCTVNFTIRGFVGERRLGQPTDRTSCGAVRHGHVTRASSQDTTPMEAIKGMDEREESLKYIDLINECLSLIVFNFVYLSY
jgi:hypothetical protein